MTTESPLPLLSLIDQLIATEPYEYRGFMWAARPQRQFCDMLGGISTRTLYNRVKRLGVQSKVIRPNKGATLFLMRIGPPDLTDPDPYAKKLRGIFRKAVEMPQPANADQDAIWNHIKQCLWGYVKQVMALPEVKALTDEPGELAVAAFKHALHNWPAVASAIRIASKARKGYKSRYWDYPNVPLMNSFASTVVFVYVDAQQEKGAYAAIHGDPKSQAVAKAAAALLDATNPFNGMLPPPGVSAEAEVTKAKVFPFKEHWKPAKSGKAA